ncbi:hypothetical protein [Streptomyces sp. NPDC058671]|uniref:hypothetical protein n=1 Tax=Streptomyces sp. NPDC058671 TaxID=3346590 RepID=UPI00365F2A21
MSNLCRELERSGYAGQRLTMLFGGPHQSLPSFQHAGVQPGDRVYPCVSTPPASMLLADPRTAEGAAANPSLPVPRMHELIDRSLNGAVTPPTMPRR